MYRQGTEAGAGQHSPSAGVNHARVGAAVHGPLVPVGYTMVLGDALEALDQSGADDERSVGQRDRGPLSLRS
jgi:hypothetical protein